MVTVKGKSEVKRFIADLPAKLEPVLRGAARAGGKIIADEIKDKTQSSEVRENVRLRVQASNGQIRARIDIKPGWARSLGIWSEYGTDPHFISVADGQRTGRGISRINQQVREHGDASLVINGKFVGQTVFHPGARQQPTFRPAMDMKEGEARAAAQNYINARVKRTGIVGGDDGDDGGDE